MNGCALMLTSNLGKTNLHTSKYWTPLSCDSPSTWIFHTPCVKKKHSTCYIISSFIEARRSNGCDQCIHSRGLCEIYLSFPADAHCCSTFTNSYTYHTLNSPVVEHFTVGYPKSTSPKTINPIQHKSVCLIFTNRRTF